MTAPADHPPPHELAGPVPRRVFLLAVFVISGFAGLIHESV